jgi:hypothetical protein
VVDWTLSLTWLIQKEDAEETTVTSDYRAENSGIYHHQIGA